MVLWVRTFLLMGGLVETLKSSQTMDLVCATCPPMSDFIFQITVNLPKENKLYGYKTQIHVDLY